MVWSGAGVDYVTTPTTGLVFGPPGTYQFTDLLLDVTNWVQNPNSNHGWMLKAQNEGSFGTAMRIGSSEDPTPANRPVLTINYTVPASAIPPTITGVSKSNNQFQFSFNAEASRTYTVEAVPSLTNSNWSVVTNFSASGSPVVRVVTNSISATNRFFRVKTP